MNIIGARKWKEKKNLTRILVVCIKIFMLCYSTISKLLRSIVRDTDNYSISVPKMRMWSYDHHFLTVHSPLLHKKNSGCLSLLFWIFLANFGEI